jgi:hypothetical protein
VAEPSPEMLLDRLGPFLASPGVIMAVLAFGAVVVPLIEEAIKPIGVWLLAGRNLRPAEGFAAGVLSGAGFAFFESISITIGAEDWVTLVVVRIGTAFIHILTTGLTGWALALAWQGKGYLRLAFTYIGVVLIHGAWNALSLLTTFTVMSQELDISVNILTLPALPAVAPVILSVMAALAFGLILLINRRLARESSLQMLQEDKLPSSYLNESVYNPPESASASAWGPIGEENAHDGVDQVSD